MEKQKRFTISESVLALLLEQVQLQPNVTANFLAGVVQNDVKPVEEEIEKSEEDNIKE